jgi:ABC-type nitrate/sulfonate/bicarbonate transport system substrate-binding protein
MKKIIVILMCIFVFFTCTAREENKITVVLDWVINTNHTGLYVALDKGYFEEQGLDVEIIFPPETGGAGLLLSGKVQFGVSYQEGITFARASGNPLIAIAAVIQHNTSGFASRKDENIISPKDFEGKNYGGWGSPIEEATIRALMKRDGGDYTKVNMISIGSMDFFAATQSNIDFTWIFEGWDGVASEIKGIDINFISLKDIEPALDYYTPVIACTNTYLEENEELVKKFLDAVSRGYRFCIENPEEAAEILLKYAPELDETLITESQKFLAGQYQADSSRWGEMKLSVWEDYADWLKNYGLLEGDFTAVDAFTNDYLP